MAKKTKDSDKIRWVIPIGLIAALLIAISTQKADPPNIMKFQTKKDLPAISKCISSRSGVSLFKGLKCQPFSDPKNLAYPEYSCTVNDNSTITVIGEIEHRYITVRAFKSLSNRQTLFLNSCASD